MKLSKLEQETIIIFNEAESTAEIYTCNTKLKNKLDKMCNEGIDVKQTKSNEYGKGYNLPKKFIEVRKRCSRTMEMKAKSQTSIAKAREKKRNGENKS